MWSKHGSFGLMTIMWTCPALCFKVLLTFSHSGYYFQEPRLEENKLNILLGNILQMLYEFYVLIMKRFCCLKICWWNTAQAAWLHVSLIMHLRLQTDRAAGKVVSYRLEMIRTSVVDQAEEYHLVLVITLKNWRDNFSTFQIIRTAPLLVTGRKQKSGSKKILTERVNFMSNY